MFDDALAAAQQIFTPPFRKTLFKTLLLTFGLLALAFAGVEKLVAETLILPYAWLVTAVSIVGGMGLVIGLGVLVTPVSFLVAGFFFDELAAVVEQDLDPRGPTGRPLPLEDATWLSLKFAGVSLAVNCVALVLWLVPGINALAFLGANAYLLGRGYFELAALRFLPFAEVRHLRKRHAVRLFVAGLVMAAFVTVPILNLLTPLFCTAFMVRVGRGIMLWRPAPISRRTPRGAGGE